MPSEAVERVSTAWKRSTVGPVVTPRRLGRALPGARGPQPEPQARPGPRRHRARLLPPGPHAGHDRQRPTDRRARAVRARGLAHRQARGHQALPLPQRQRQAAAPGRADHAEGVPPAAPGRQRRLDLRPQGHPSSALQPARRARGGRRRDRGGREGRRRADRPRRGRHHVPRRRREVARRVRPAVQEQEGRGHPGRGSARSEDGALPRPGPPQSSARRSNRRASSRRCSNPQSARTCPITSPPV